MTLHLSKSGYCIAVQCPKAFWLGKFKPECFDDSVLNEHILDQGSRVGDLAMDLLGDYTEVPYGDLSGMIEETKRLTDAGEKHIAEASFSYKGLFCSVDILNNLGGGRAEIYEVKSSTSLHEIYEHDTAYQYYVLTKLGYKVTGVYLVHIDPSYVRKGEIELQKLFKINDLTERAKELFPEVERRIANLELLIGQGEPDVPLSKGCASPYPCGYFGYCTRFLPKPNIFDVAGMKTETKLAYYSQGIFSFEELLEKGKKLNPGQTLQLRHELEELPDRIDREAVRDFLSGLGYPLYFLDFETMQPAVPLFDDSRPYQQITFQYSLHYIEREGGELRHKEFLARPEGDPRRPLAEQLARDIPRNACVLAYNMSFEKGRIRELAELFKDLSAQLMSIHDSIRDLMVPFQKKQYYNHAMRGSYSIKYVLPALYPDDPSLDYHNLEGVHNGGEASSVFEEMYSVTKEEAEEKRKQLLAYCGLDTYAMVKVWEKLRRAAE